MACRYYYKGHQFDNEYALDDFLIEKQPFEAELGDMVFLMDTPLSQQLSRALELRKTYAKERAENKEAIRGEKGYYNEDGDWVSNSSTYIGVTKFLSTLRKADGTYLFPEFIADNYFALRYEDWKKGSFTEEEKALFGNAGPITSLTALLGMRDTIERKWNWLGYLGTTLHKVMELCFTLRADSDNYIFERTTEEATAEIINRLGKKADELTPGTVENLVRYAKSIHASLLNKFKGPLVYIPEFSVTDQTTIEEGDSKKRVRLTGRIDLLVIDGSGTVHIVDFKSSPKPYTDYNSAKKGAFRYQLGMYNRMLKRNGLNSSRGQMFIAPIKINNIHYYKGYHYDDITCADVLQQINAYESDTIWDEIDRYLPVPFTVTLSTSLANTVISLQMHNWGLTINESEISREALIKKLKKQGVLTPDENGVYHFGRGKNHIEAASESELVSKVEEFYKKQPAKLDRLVANVKHGIYQSILEGSVSPDYFPQFRVLKSGSVSEQYMADMIKPYCNGAWEVVDCDPMESRGCIVLKTRDGIYPQQIDIIRVSTHDLTASSREELDAKGSMRNRKNLLAKFESDIVEKTTSNSLMLTAINGNIELMETMLLINQTSGFEDYVIGSIKVMNPFELNGIEATNEELLYCWKALCKRDKAAIVTDRFSSGEVKLATLFDKLMNNIDRMLYEGKEHRFFGDYHFASGDVLAHCKSLLHLCISDLYDVNLKIKALLEIYNDMKAYTSDNTGTFQVMNRNKAALILANALFAAALLRGINFRLQIADHGKWVNSWAVWNDGLEGLYTDNPGNMSSETLNTIHKMLLESYQNTRDDMLREKGKLDELISKLKKEKGLSYILEGVSNLASLYSNMWEHTADGDFVFKNPNRLTGAEKEFLEYILDKINRNRYPMATEEALLEMKENNDIKYYRVPLMKGHLDSAITVDGLLNVLKGTLRCFSPKYIKGKIVNGLKSLNNTLSDVDYRDNEVMFKMTNLFDAGEGENRLEIIQDEGFDSFEHNFENLIYNHLFAYSSLKNIDDVFPMIKAAFIHLSDQGLMQNRQFNNDLDYMKKYMKNKIFQKAIDDPKMGLARTVMTKGRATASMLTLAFSPVLRVYQELMSLWVNISLAIRLPDKMSADGKTAFTFKNFKKVVPMVYADMFHYSDRRSFWEALNESLGLNDMDMRFYGELINHSRKGLFNFSRFALLNTTRPDFYHRCVILGCKMEADGCLDACSLDEQGNIVYDWTKDKRFEVFASGNTSDPRYAAQRSLYYTMAKDFEAENAKMPDGTYFKLNMRKPMALPRMYTVKQIESIKSLSDDIYGYYTDEKKSLMFSMWLGALWFQFRTYWSAKKNLYLLSGGVRLRGEYALLVMGGEKMYYLVIDGLIRDDLPFTTEDTGAPVMLWQGLWQEGVILTLSEIIRLTYNTGSLTTAFLGMWNNENYNLRYAYQNNIKKLGYDLFLTMFFGNFLVGNLLKQDVDRLTKLNKQDKDIMEGMLVAAYNVLYRSLRTSLLDSNALESFGKPAYDWQPFVIVWWGRQAKNFINICLGDKNAWDGLIKVSSAATLVKPFFDSIKPDYFELLDKERRRKKQKERKQEKKLRRAA